MISTNSRQNRLLWTGYIQGSWNAPSSKWSWITDPDPHHCKGTHPEQQNLLGTYFECCELKLSVEPAPRSRGCICRCWRLGVGWSGMGGGVGWNGRWLVLSGWNNRNKLSAKLWNNYNICLFNPAEWISSYQALKLAPNYSVDKHRPNKDLLHFYRNRKRPLMFR